MPASTIIITPPWVPRGIRAAPKIRQYRLKRWKSYQVPLFGSYMGRPPGRNVDSSPSREAVRICHPQAAVRFGNGQPEPAAGGGRAGTGVPELGYVLRCGYQLVTASHEHTNGRADRAVLEVRPLHEPRMPLSARMSISYGHRICRLAKIQAAGFSRRVRPMADRGDSPFPRP
jgi:hypothetical protein